jgi:dTDP-4-dehydrorhamnose reductase
LHVYGETKVEAERVVLANPRHLVVRTSINAGASITQNRAFNEQLRRSLQGAGQVMKLFTDEFRCPIPAAETARAVWELVQKDCRGIYHIAGAEKLSRWQIGQLLAKNWPEITVKLESGSAREFPGPPRALDTSLNIAKVQAELATPLLGLSEWLARNHHQDF